MSTFRGVGDPTADGIRVASQDDLDAAVAAADQSAQDADASATASATSAQESEQALYEFNGVWLRSQATDPTEDLNGDPLTAGDLYHNSTSGDIFRYDGAAWKSFGMGGPSSAVDENIVVFDGTTGTLTKDGGKSIAEVGDVDGPASSTTGNLAVFADTTGKLLADGGPPGGGSGGGTFLVEWEFDNTSTAEADPGDGKFRLNNVEMGLASEMYIADKSLTSITMDESIEALVVGAQIVLTQSNDRTKSMAYTVAAAPVKTGGFGGYYTIEINGNGAPGDGGAIFSPAAAVGFNFLNLAGGGGGGSTVVGWAFDSTVSGTPGDGEFTLDVAASSMWSATELRVNVRPNTGTAFTVSALLGAFRAGDFINLMEEGDPSNAIVYQLTAPGVFTSTGPGTGYYTFSVSTPGLHFSGEFAAGAAVTFSLYYPAVETPVGKNYAINPMINTFQKGKQKTNMGASNETYVDGFEFFTDMGELRVTQDVLNTNLPTDAADADVSNTLRTTITTPESALGADEKAGMAMHIEAQDMRDWLWGTPDAKPVTVSFLAQSNIDLGGGEVTLPFAIQNKALTQSCVFAYTLTQFVWTKVVITIPGPTDVSFADAAENDIGASFMWMIQGGNQVTSGGVWEGADRTGINTADDTYNQTGFYLEITKVKIEVGDTATDFSQDMEASAWDRIRRYYQTSRTRNEDIAVFSTNGQRFQYATNSGLFRENVILPTTMRAAPSVSVRDPVTGASGVRQAGTTQSATVSDVNEHSFCVTMGAAPATANATIEYHWDSDATMKTAH